jgi:dienelactone hydrolase
MNDLEALKLAERGFAALAFSFFGVPGTPPRLSNVKLENTLQAARWLKQQPVNQGQPLFFSGNSRGAEQLLILLSTQKDTSLIAAAAVHAGIDEVDNGYDPHLDMGLTSPAWTLGNKPLKFGQRIAAEKYPGPLFISHGKNDSLFPSDASQRLAAKHKAAGRRVELHILRGEEHHPKPATFEKLLDQRAQFFNRVAKNLKQ